MSSKLKRQNCWKYIKILRVKPKFVSNRTQLSMRKIKSVRNFKAKLVISRINYAKPNRNLK